MKSSPTYSSLTCSSLLIITLVIIFSSPMITLGDESFFLSPEQSPSSLSSCSSASNCSECISMAGCSYCWDHEFDDQTYSRCESSKRILENLGCRLDKIHDPVNKLTIVTNETSGTPGPMKLSPQKIRMALRPNTPLRVPIRLKQEENYPVDLYYLMDLTYSMKDHKETLATLADQLTRDMSNMTKNFRVGFGSFIDKIVMPFASMVPEKLVNPCSDGMECVSPYSYKNHLSLTNSHADFINEVKQASLSGNLDNAEGGLDAIIQAVVCKDKINWESNSASSGVRRKILLFATGSEFHFAGDGKLGGVIKPNDLQCHLDENGYYDYSLEMDYPTVSQVNKVITSNKVNLIFAVTPDAVNIYNSLSAMIDGSVVGIMSQDSQNIVSLIRENYDKIVSRVELTSDLQDDRLDIKFFSRCKQDKENKDKNQDKDREQSSQGQGQISQGQSSDLKETNVCQDIKIGDFIDFEVEITIKRCPKDNEPPLPKLIKISPIGLNIESVIHISSKFCSCNCESSLPMAETNVSSVCSNNGQLICGTCHCHNGHFGKFCECQGGSKMPTNKMNECKRPIGGQSTSSGSNSSSDPSSSSGLVSRLSSLECSNHGFCNCGQCVCESGTKKGDRYFGKYCECDNFSCDRNVHDGSVCSNHGKCCDGHCDCDEGWTGSSCQCTTSVDTCIGPNNKICSGNGRCTCGQCICAANVAANESSSLVYVGTFCEECLTCDGKCSEIEECIKCKDPELTNTYNDEECRVKCIKFDIEFINDTDQWSLLEAKRSLDTNKNVKRCKLTNDEGCHSDFNYEFNYETEIASVKVSTMTSCPSEASSWWIIVLSIIGAIVIIGLLLICVIRGLVYMKDLRDFKKWSEEVEATKKGMNTKSLNPLYREANTKYQNPLYNKEH